MTEHARVVIIGGGNMGAGVLYHLAAAGWRDCLLLEKAELTAGATWHAAGLVSRMVAGHALGTLHDYAVELYQRIEAQTGQSVSWHGCGSLRAVGSDDHLDWIRHLRDAILARGQPAEIIGPEAIKALNPLYEVSGVRAALHTPGDGHVDPAGACFALAKGARQMGAAVRRRCRATTVRGLPSGEWEVDTEHGAVRCEHVVNAAGYHARQVGAWSGLDLPIVTMEHHYVVTEDVPAFAEMDHEIPVCREDYFRGYLRREQRAALIGLYDREAPQPVWLGGCPWSSESELLAPAIERIAPSLERAFERFPALRNLGIKRIVNGGITYTPDGAMLLGPAPGLTNYWLACGATVGIAWGPGAGRTLAEWMVHGTAAISTRGVDPRRFGDFVDYDYATTRVAEDYRRRIELPYPGQQPETKRGIRCSGAHARTDALGAVYEDAAGWERPRYYAPPGEPREEPLAWRRPAHFSLIGAECRTVRQRVGLGDFSAFAKLEVRGAGAETFLERVCANRVPRHDGRCALTLLLNPQGTIEGEMTLARLRPGRYYAVTGAPSERRVWDWLHAQRHVDEDVALVNRSDGTGIVVVAGPEARRVLEATTTAEVSNASFPWMSAREITVGDVPVRALRLSFTGELAFELHAPNAGLESLWDALWHAGEPFGMAPFGSLALNSLRMEKAYRGGHELTNDATPTEADLLRLVRRDKDFIGRAALARRRVATRLALLALDQGDADCLGGEAVFAGGQRVGSVTSGAYGHCTGVSLAFAYLQVPFAAPGTELTVSLLDERRPARVLPGAIHDAGNERLRA